MRHLADKLAKVEEELNKCKTRLKDQESYMEEAVRVMEQNEKTMNKMQEWIVGQDHWSAETSERVKWLHEQEIKRCSDEDEANSNAPPTVSNKENAAHHTHDARKDSERPVKETPINVSHVGNI